MKAVMIIISAGALFLLAEKRATKSNKVIVEEAFERWASGEGSLFDLLDERVEWTIAGSGKFSGTYSGKNDFIDNAVEPIMEKLSTPIHPTLISLAAEGETVWLHWKGRATTTTGGVYTNEYAWKLQLKDNKITKAVAFLDLCSLEKLFINELKKDTQTTMEESKAYIGTWVTKDGYIRHELLTGNRYDEARGDRKSAYQGSYKVTGDHIDYKDDTGFTADGEFRDGILYHGGMVLYKEEN